MFPDSTSAVVSVIISQSSNGDDETLLLDDCWSSISVERSKESGLLKKSNRANLTWNPVWEVGFDGKFCL